ncbi:MAG: trimethylamine methyltransferase family protein [Armatimonadota bacterium]
MFQRFIISDDHVEPLAEGVLTTLERVGVLCQNHEMMRGLDALGAQVDYPAERVHFPRELTAQFIDTIRAEFAAEPQPHRLGAPGLPGIGTQVAQLYLDHRTGELRQANQPDMITLIKLGDVLHGADGVGHVLSLTDCPPMIEPLVAGLLLAEYAHVPQGPFAWHVDQTPWLKEMGEILGIDNWFTWGAICFAHPLRFDRDTAGRFVARAKAGGTCGLTAMPVAGVSTPVTVEGFVVVAAAEHVATWMAARALNPQVPLGGSMWPGTVDMATGAVSYSAWDALFYGFACVEFIRRWVGINIPMGSGEYCDARVPGLYAALEKAYKSMTVAAFTGQSLSAGTGMLDEGKIMSPVQLLLDREFAAGAAHLARELDPTPENLAIDDIIEVDLGISMSHLGTMRTAQRFRDGMWLPRLVERSGYAGHAREDNLLAKVADEVDRLLATYHKPEGREDQLAAMRAIVERAKRALL